MFCLVLFSFLFLIPRSIKSKLLFFSSFYIFLIHEIVSVIFSVSSVFFCVHILSIYKIWREIYLKSHHWMRMKLHCSHFFFFSFCSCLVEEDLSQYFFMGTITRTQYRTKRVHSCVQSESRWRRLYKTFWSLQRDNRMRTWATNEISNVFLWAHVFMFFLEWLYDCCDDFWDEGCGF